MIATTFDTTDYLSEYYSERFGIQLEDPSHLDITRDSNITRRCRVFLENTMEYLLELKSGETILDSVKGGKI